MSENLYVKGGSGEPDIAVKGDTSTGAIKTYSVNNDSIITLLTKNSSVAILSSTARTATTNSADVTNTNNTGVHVVVDVTNVAGAASITVKLQGKQGSNYYDLTSGTAAITATGLTVIRLFPSANPETGLVANDSLPGVWRVVVTHANSDSITYAVGANYVG